MILDQQPLPDRGNHIGFLGIALKTDLEMSGGNTSRAAATIAKVQQSKHVAKRALTWNP